jgi:hypothetical protein
LPNETEIDSQVVKTEKCQLEEEVEDLSRRKKVFFKMYWRICENPAQNVD